MLSGAASKIKITWTKQKCLKCSVLGNILLAINMFCRKQIEVLQVFNQHYCTSKILYTGLLSNLKTVKSHLTSCLLMEDVWQVCRAHCRVGGVRVDGVGRHGHRLARSGFTRRHRSPQPHQSDILSSWRAALASQPAGYWLPVSLNSLLLINSLYFL